ncbi:anti-anti sigma factor protein [Sorangium cellulosum]|uniref:Anti-anti sigma factor protein n=1 Tax=Sorangium cellulosum TaxID=56 RepID=A0A2L0F9F5_SORCE|nr:STAS domain-containing protein [Sorangium cellulosum]AUX48200.1 anti-anti sigma factor protein [Sorangium cellulosum]
MSFLDQRLSALDLSILPTWIYDHDLARFQWANPKGLEFWRASDRADLSARDLSDLSAAARARLDGYMRVIADGGVVVEDWTLYPRGVPATVTLHGEGIRLDDGRLAILFQALPRQPGIDASMVRGVEAVRHSSVLVSVVDEDGVVLFHNPAALRALGDAPRIDAAFPDDGVAAAIRGAISAEAPWTGEVRVHTTAGERWHQVEARRTTDPVTGAPAVLVQQLDVSAQRRAEGRVEEQGRLIDELNRSLALVEEQRRQILTLSAPILDVGRGTLAVPLIGPLDAERGDELGERLLPAIVAQRAAHVVLDVTGTDALDPDGAAALERLARAIQLLGSRPILTGVRPEVARALAQTELGGGLLVLRSLGRGLEVSRRRAARRRRD